MAAASDKARFHLEQHVPALQLYARKNIFSRDEIASITSKRSTFEHILCSRGGSTPADYARYTEYEINLAALLRKRCQRLGIKDRKNLLYNGKKNVFAILDRGTKKFPGDMGLWMQYIRFCQKEKANKKLAKVLTACLRLRPREWGVWVLAAKWYAEEQGDFQTARGYIQRGLRFCGDIPAIWGEYVRLEMGFLAKIAGRRKLLGLDPHQQNKDDREELEHAEEDGDMIALPTITATEFMPDTTTGGTEEVDNTTLQRISQAPVFTGAIPIAIFDAAMKHFENDSMVATLIFDIVADFDQVPASSTILHHILAYLKSLKPESPDTIICEAKFSLFKVDVLSVDFPSALGAALSRIKTGVKRFDEKQPPKLAEGAILMLLPLFRERRDMDEDIVTVLTVSVNRHLQTLASAPKAATSKAIKALVAQRLAEGRTLGADELWAVYSAER